MKTGEAALWTPPPLWGRVRVRGSSDRYGHVWHVGIGTATIWHVVTGT